MWSHFLIQVLFTLILMYGLGLPIISLFPQLERIKFGCAPLVSLFILLLLSNSYLLLGIQTNWLGLVVPMVLIGIVAVAVCGGPKIVRHTNLKYVALYVSVSAVVVAIYYVRPLDGAASFAQGYDNYAHLTKVRDYLNSGFYADGFISYPELWRTLTAVVASFDGGLVTVAANAVNCAVISIVLPLSILSLLLAISNDKTVILSGCVVAIAFQAFPWAFLYFGPLYPNMLGNAILPSVMAIFVLLLKAETYKSFLSELLPFGLGCLVLLFSHPSSIFMGIVLLLPYAIKEIAHNVKMRTGSKAIALWSSFAFVLFVLGVWTACFYSPLFASTVKYNWISRSSIPQALGSILTLSLDKVSAQQLTLSLLVFIGVCHCWLRKTNRWLVVSFAISCFIYTVCVSTEGWLKHFLSGFWYTDSYRVAAIVAMSCIPLSALGLSAITKRFSKLVEKDRQLEAKALTLMVMGVLIFSPSLPLVRSSDLAESVTLTTSFGYTSALLNSFYSLADGESVYDSKEVDFVSQVKTIVGDAKVLNFPYDGSIFSYGVNNLNVCNRTWDGYGSTGDAYLINRGINRVSFDERIKSALIKDDVRYLLLLDYGNDTDKGLNYSGYDYEDWIGLENVNDETEGFTLLLSSDDMRLYRIEIDSD